MRENRLGTMFKFDPSWMSALNDYDGETVKTILNALCEWRDTGEIPDSLTGEARGTLKFIIVNIERMDEWSEELSDKRREAGYRGLERRYGKTYEPSKSSKPSKQSSKPSKSSILSMSYPNNASNEAINLRDIQDVSLSQDTCDDTPSEIRKQKLLENKEVKEVASYYNARLKETRANFAECISVSGNRASNVSARLKEYGMERVKQAIDKIFASKWIAENTKPSVRNISWIMRPENCRKILEGTYDNDKQRQQNRPTVPSAHFSNEGDRSKWAHEKEKWEQ